MTIHTSDSGLFMGGVFPFLKIVIKFFIRGKKSRIAVTIDAGIAGRFGGNRSSQRQKQPAQKPIKKPHLDFPVKFHHQRR